MKVNSSDRRLACDRVVRLASRLSTHPAHSRNYWSRAILCCTVQAQTSVCGSKEYLAALPVPPPKNSTVKRQVQLINCSNQVILGAVAAAHDAGQPPYPVFPQDGTWVMQPFGSPNNANVLTRWIYQRSGMASLRQAASLRISGHGLAAATIRLPTVRNAKPAVVADSMIAAPRTFHPLLRPPWPNGRSIKSWETTSSTLPTSARLTARTLPSISHPSGGDDLNPSNPKDFHWLNWNYPLTVHGADLREPMKCSNSNNYNFAVKRSDIDKTSSSIPNYPQLGYVVVDSNGNPTMPSGDNALACLSNCGRYKFPVEVGKTGCDATTNPNCYAWTTFCAGNDAVQWAAVQYGCRLASPLMGASTTTFPASRNKVRMALARASCGLSTMDRRGQCNGVGNPQPSGPASTVACNNTYGSVNPLDPDNSTKFDWADQPPDELCSNVVFGQNNMQIACIGDDTLHAVLHGAYTWPNDPGSAQR